MLHRQHLSPALNVIPVSVARDRNLRIQSDPSAVNSFLHLFANPFCPIAENWLLGANRPYKLSDLIC